MPASTAWAAFGTLFKIGAGVGSGSYTTVPMVSDIPGPGEMNDFVEVTSHTSPSRSKEWIATLRDNKAFTIKMFWDPAEPTHIALKAEADNGTRNDYQIVLPGSRGAFTFTAFIGEFDANLAVKAAAEQSVQVRPTGAMPFA